MGGATATAVAISPQPTGLSPRGRGNHVHTLGHRPRQQSIPAWAGQPSAWKDTKHSPKVYPRVGGATIVRQTHSMLETGLSPRGRGNRNCGRDLTAAHRSIPAWAGQPLPTCGRCSLAKVCPRACGGTSGESSRTTHGTADCIDACRYFGGLIVGAVLGETKETLLAPRYTPVADLWDREPMCPEIDEVAGGSFMRRESPEIVGSGYVVKSVEAALWAFHRSEAFEEGCLLAVNLGDDADTTAAIYGQLAGAYYGIDGVPKEWKDAIAQGELILGLADRLLEAAGQHHPIQQGERD